MEQEGEYTVTSLDQMVDQLAHARKVVKQNKAVLDALRKQMEANPAYIAAKAALTIAQANEDALDKNIRERAVNEYLWSDVKSKQPHSKIGIREKIVAVITDKDALREWCLKNMMVAMIVDEKLMKDYAAKSDVTVPGVICKTEVTATIASDLETSEGSQE